MRIQIKMQISIQIKIKVRIQIRIKIQCKSEYVSNLEQRHYKNGFVSVKRMLILKLPSFFPCRFGEGKRAVISKQTCFSQKQIRSYIVLALESLLISCLHKEYFGLSYLTKNLFIESFNAEEKTMKQSFLV